MDTTIRNLDPSAYRSLKARAAMAGMTLGEAVNEAIRAYLAHADLPPKQGTLRDIAPWPFPDGNERLSEEIDRIAYGG